MPENGSPRTEPDGSDREAARPAAIERSFRTSIVYAPEAPAALIRRFSGEIDPLLRNGRMLKDGDRCTVVQIDAAGGSFVVKRYNRKGPLHTAGHLVLRSRAAWCWRNACRVLGAGLATPAPLACRERRVGPFRLESYLLTTYVDGPTLLEYVRSGDAEPAGLEKLADEFGRIWRGLGALRARHHDMKATNFIVDDERRLWMLDLDGMRTGLSGPRLRHARRVDRERFMRNWQDWPEVADRFRARIDTP